MHHPHKDALVIMAEIANSLVHKILVDNGSAVNILYWHTYQKTELTRADLSPMTSPVYKFTGDHVVPEGTIKLVVTLGEYPQVTTIMTEFLPINCLLAFNGVSVRSLLQVAKAVTSIHCLTMKFSTAAGIIQVRGR